MLGIAFRLPRRVPQHGKVDVNVVAGISRIVFRRTEFINPDDLPDKTAVIIVRDDNHKITGLNFAVNGFRVQNKSPVFHSAGAHFLYNLIVIF
jgi:hypothetical protein